MEVSGEVSVFRKEGVLGQEKTNISLSFQPEYFKELGDGTNSFTLIPFVRIDENDSERTHFDLREFKWVRQADALIATVGVDVVYWGVTESQQLVNVVNQSDFVEDINGQTKLGQPLISVSYSGDYGVFENYVLLGFRERTFPGLDGRYAFPLEIQQDEPLYASDKEYRHIDFASRWSQQFGGADIGLAFFQGTERMPFFLLDTTGGIDNLSLRPFYDQVRQFGADLQYISGSYLWKLETVHKEPQNNKSYLAGTVGLEYTQVGILGSRSDLGWIIEYLFDDRDELAPAEVFESDLFIGARWVPNDLASSELLISLIQDIDGSEKLFSLEWSSRINDSWKINMLARVFSGGDELHSSAPDFLNRVLQPDPQHKLAYLLSEDSFRITLSKYF